MKRKYSNMEIIRNMTLMDDIFMSVFFDNNPPCVEDILDAVLPVKVKVEKVRTQYKRSNLSGHSVTFDILAEDSEGKTYDIEIQKKSEGASPRRARFHSSLLDSQVLEKGEDYDLLNDTYVIFITERDVLRGQKPVYYIERTIKGLERAFNDGSNIIYINTAYKGKCSKEIEDLIHDLRTSDPKKIRNRNISRKFQQIYNDPDGKELDTMCELLEETIKLERAESLEAGREEGRAEGRAEGREEGRAEGRELGREEGREEGLEEGREEGQIIKSLEIAKNLLLLNEMSVEAIAKVCHLSVEKVNELKRELDE